MTYPRSPRRPNPAVMQAECDRFNRLFGVGETIKVWTGPREGEPVERTVRDPGACVLSGHTPVVYVHGGGGCIALSHVAGFVTVQ